MGRIQEEDKEPGALDKPWSRDEFKNRRRPRYYRTGDAERDKAALDDFLDKYTPYSVEPDIWDVIGPLTRYASRLSFGDTVDLWSLAGTHARFLRWAHLQGMPVSIQLYHPDIIDRHVMSRQLTSSGRSGVRNRLTKVGRLALGPPLYPAPRVLNKRNKLTVPYSRDDKTRLSAAIRGQSTAFRRQNLAALLGLGLGAGLSSQELALVTGADVESDSDGVLVHVTTGNHPRTVPVLRRWEEHVHAAAVRVGERPLFLPNRRRMQRYDTPNFIKNLDLPTDLPVITAGRLRVTWIVHHYAIGTPVNVIAAAAGMTTDQVGRYAQHLPMPPPDEIRSLLRGTT